jgi:ABC-type multidrug transport system ATPase subunit
MKSDPPKRMEYIVCITPLQRLQPTFHSPLYSQGTLLRERMSSAAPQPAIRLDRASKLYGSFAALRDVSLSIAAGASVVLLGENGAGKSTLLKLITGLETPTYGSVAIFGNSPREERSRIATMGHATMLYDELTGIENLTYFASLYAEGASSAALKAQAEESLLGVALDPANPRRVGEYSQGMRQRASLARALMNQPDLLLLDEPFSNLDTASAQAMIERLLQFCGQPGSDGIARTLILTTHQAELARPLARTTITMRAGRVASIESAAGGGHA